jgi:hypothetical protein
LRSPANALAADLAAAIHGVGAYLADPASGVGGKLTPTPNGIAGRTTTGLDCLGGLACGILLSGISHVFLLWRLRLRVLLKVASAALMRRTIHSHAASHNILLIKLHKSLYGRIARITLDPIWYGTGRD